jgi:hypothetical protein
MDVAADLASVAYCAIAKLVGARMAVFKLS